MRLNLFRSSATGHARVQPIEVGTVVWGRSLASARSESTTSAKPIFALFQEVPGCAGCKQFGADVLSNPVLVDAIEHEFVPLLIHNNQPGEDAEVLAHFGEPAWNYQVVRFLDGDGADIIERRDRVWDVGPLAHRMVTALETAGRSVPDYLRLVEQEHSDRLRTAYIAQACFWTGELELGQIDGVVTTEAGFMQRNEVTRVVFDPAVVSLASLVGQAQTRGVATAVSTTIAGIAELDSSHTHVSVASESAFRLAPNSDQKRQLDSGAKRTDLSLAQLTKLNAWTRTDPGRAHSYLSPRQATRWR